MSDEALLYEVRDSVAHLKMNRPDKRNALDDDLIVALKTALQRAQDDEVVRVGILYGAGPDFCAGADLAALQKISTASVAENLRDARSLMELFELIRQVRFPLIAAVRGRALAGGCGLALACDLVVAEASARVGFPEVKIGFVPAMVMAILRRNLSEKKAFELIALGGEISASEAASLGLINLVVDSSSFEAEVQSMASRLTKISASAVSLSKSLLYKSDGLALSEALACGADVNVIARMSKDCKKGVARFLNKE